MRQARGAASNGVVRLLRTPTLAYARCSCQSAASLSWSIDRLSLTGSPLPSPLSILGCRDEPSLPAASCPAAVGSRVLLFPSGAWFPTCRSEGCGSDGADTTASTAGRCTLMRCRNRIGQRTAFCPPDCAASLTICTQTTGCWEPKISPEHMFMRMRPQQM